MKIKSLFHSIRPGRCPGNFGEGCQECNHMSSARLDNEGGYVECSYIVNVVGEINKLNSQEDSQED